LNHLNVCIHADISIITPGLIGLNLTIIHGHDMYMVEDAINDILHAISVEHPIVHTVQKHLTKRAREQQIGRQELEQIVTFSTENVFISSFKLFSIFISVETSINVL
jgi:hypothetical protein